MNPETHQPSAALTSRILGDAHRALHPSAWRVFTKLAGIHFAVALLTLSVCPQFGFRIFGEGHGLMHTFMQFGVVGCMAACGAFFVGTSVLVASLLLLPEEIRVLRQRRALQLGSLTTLSLGAFFMANTTIVAHLGLIWAAGSVFGGLLTLEAGWLLRRKFLFGTS